MSIDVMTKVIQRAPVSGSELTCMLIMANWCNDDGDSLYPSVALLAGAMRLSESQARRVLHGLMPETDDAEANGNWWFRVVGNHQGGAPGMSRRYQMNVARLDTLPKLPEFEKADRRRQKKVSTGSANARGSAGARGSAHATTRVAPMRPDSSEEPSIKRERADACEVHQFEKARAAWPSGFADGREQALTAWKTLNSEDRADAAAEIGRFVTAARAIGRKHLCTFGTYLSERRWQALPERSKPIERATDHPKASGSVMAAQTARLRMKPTAFQLANPEMYPELFSKPEPATGTNAS